MCVPVIPRRATLPPATNRQSPEPNMTARQLQERSPFAHTLIFCKGANAAIQSRRCKRSNEAQPRLRERRVAPISFSPAAEDQARPAKQRASGIAGQLVGRKSAPSQDRAPRPHRETCLVALDRATTARPEQHVQRPACRSRAHKPGWGFSSLSPAPPPLAGPKEPRTHPPP